MFKSLKDHVKKYFVKIFFDNYLPEELFELNDYFRHYQSIRFSYKKKRGKIIAISTDFKYGTIITSGRNKKELDKNIKDAILTAFEVPSAYAKEAKIVETKKNEQVYALA